MSGDRRVAFALLIVGRDLVVSSIDAALADAMGGHGHLLLRAGEAEIGKTTIARAK